jgi:cobalamin biosynthesis protein CbiM
VFAAQMVNFPVAAGTSGHLLGGVLTAVLLGPWVGSVVVTVVVVVQALVFADGGLTALGLNLFNMALIGAVAGWFLYRIVLRMLPNRPASVPVAAGITAGVSVVLAALGFTLQYAIGGEGAVAVGTVAAAMVGVHALIGIGEGVITAFVVGAVMRARPDLVAGRSREAVRG